MRNLIIQVHELWKGLMSNTNTSTMRVSAYNNMPDFEDLYSKLYDWFSCKIAFDYLVGNIPKN